MTDAVFLVLIALPFLAAVAALMMLIGSLLSVSFGMSKFEIKLPLSFSIKVEFDADSRADRND